MSINYPIRSITCTQCGKVVTKRQPATKLFCSEQCARIRNSAKRKTGEQKECAICGKEVYIPQNRLGKPVYFCSPEHANQWQGRNKIEYCCKTCNKPFRKSASFEKLGRVLYCSPQCRNGDPDWHTKLIEMNAIQQRGYQTEIERIGYALLDNLGIEYLPQHVIGKKFCVDAFVPSIGLVIQFDGDYWHFNPAKFQEPDARQRKRIRLDQSQDNYMKACGYTVLRIWESDLRYAVGTVRETIRHALPPSSQ